MKKLVLFTVIAVALALSACNKKDGGSSGGGTTATTPAPCNVNGLQSNACNPGVYNGNGSGWLAYNNNTNSCACPSGSILVYNSSYGLGCAPIGQYQVNQFVVVNGQSLNVNTLIYNGGSSNACGFSSAYYSCDLRVSNSCANLGGGTCVATGGGTAVGICMNGSNTGNNVGVIDNGTSYWPNNNNNCQWVQRGWGYIYYCYSSWGSWYKATPSNVGGIPR